LTPETYEGAMDGVMYAGDLEMVKLIKSSNGFESWNKTFPAIASRGLGIASGAGQVEMVKYLRKMDRAIDVNNFASSGHTALTKASRQGNVNMVKYLLSMKARIDTQDMAMAWGVTNAKTPLTEAAFGGHVDVVELLLLNEEDPNVETNGYRTPLVNVALNSRLERDAISKITSALCKAKANVEHQCKDGFTAMAHAIAIGNHHALQALFVMGSNHEGFDYYSLGGIDMDVKIDEFGEYPHDSKLPSRMSKMNITSRKASPHVDNKRISSTASPLFQAIIANNMDCLRVLDGYCVNMNHVNKESMGARCLVKILGGKRKKTMKLLEERGYSDVECASIVELYLNLVFEGKDEGRLEQSCIPGSLQAGDDEALLSEENDHEGLGLKKNLEADLDLGAASAEI